MGFLHHYTFRHRNGRCDSIRCCVDQAVRPNVLHTHELETHEVFSEEYG
jgi:hypothetical protein